MDIGGILMATSFLMEGRIQDARVEIRLAITQGAVGARVDLHLARIAFASGEFDDAIRGCREELKLRPCDTAALTLLQDAYFASGRSVRAFCTLLRVLPEMARVNPVRAAKKALASVIDCLALVPGGINKAAWRVTRRSPRCARWHLRIWPPDLREVAIGRSLLDSGRPLAALRQFERVLAIWPERVESLTAYAVALAKLGRSSDSVAVIDKALQLAPGDPVLEWNREQMAAGRVTAASRILVMNGRRRTARRACRSDDC